MTEWGGPSTSPSPTPPPAAKRGIPAWVVAARVVVVLLLIPAGLYVAPRLIALVATPTALVEAAEHGARYNTRLPVLVSAEHDTLNELAALDRMDSALARVRGTDAQVASELHLLIGQVRLSVQPLLDHTDTNVAALLRSLDLLEARLNSLRKPVGQTGRELRADRRELAEVLDTARETATTVERARRSADAGANNVAGPPR